MKPITIEQSEDLAQRLRGMIEATPTRDLANVIGQLEALKAVAWSRLMSAPAAEPSHSDADLLTAEQVAERLQTTARWVRDNQDRFPKVDLPGRMLRFSAKRLDTMIKNRAYG
jgi:hypothetical protein